MHVHMVLLQNNHIMPKMAQWLIDRLGWTASDKPDPSADINHYVPYFLWDIDEHPPTITTAHYSHYEQKTAWKVKLWHESAKHIDVPIVTAPMYCSMLKGAQVVTPGVDRDRFSPGPKTDTGDNPRVGMCGIGHPRKGPKLIVDLFYSGIGIDLIIAGLQWPFPYVMVAEDSMPQWFRNLDVYLCTSLIEGIPVPPLEALACDVKIVIPDGVGICDQLPEMEGIRHYRKGDGQDMIRAIKQVLDDKPSEGALRDVTLDYTIDQWCSSHHLIMEKILDGDLSTQMSELWYRERNKSEVV